MFGNAGVCVVNSDWPVLLTADTVSVALALVNPAAEPVIVAVPDVDGVKLEQRGFIEILEDPAQ